MNEAQAQYDAGGSGLFQVTIKDAADVPIALSNLATVTLTLRNAKTGGTVNGRSAQNVKNTNDCTFDTSTGVLTWNIRPLDTTLADPYAATESHVADFVWTYDVGTGITKTGKGSHELVCVPQGRVALCTSADVSVVLKSDIADAQLPLIDRLIDTVTRRAEKHTARSFAWRSGVSEVFSVYGTKRSLLLSRWPITAVASIKEDSTSVFGTAASTLSTDLYTPLSEFGVIRLRYGYQGSGDRVLQVTYDGGAFHETAAVDDDLRWAAAEQVAFQFQQGPQLGVTSVAAGGEGGSVTLYERDLLERFRKVLDYYRRPQLSF